MNPIILFDQDNVTVLGYRLLQKITNRILKADFLLGTVAITYKFFAAKHNHAILCYSEENENKFGPIVYCFVDQRKKEVL